MTSYAGWTENEIRQYENGLKRQEAKKKRRADRKAGIKTLTDAEKARAAAFGPKKV